MNKTFIFPTWYALMSVLAAGLIIIPQYDKAITYGLSLQLLPSLMYIYGAAFLALVIAVISGKNKWWHVTWWLGVTGSTWAGGLMLAGVWENFNSLQVGHVGMSNLFEVSLLILWTTGGFGAYYDRRVNGRLNLLLVPLLLAGAVFVMWLGSLGVGTPQPLVPALQNPILPFHVMANFLAYACFFVAAVAGGVLLLQSKFNWKLADANTLDDIAARSIIVGFPLFSIAVVLGCVWAYQAWGGYWSWDPKETWALIVWLCYAGYLHARLTIGWSQEKLALWALVGFILTLFCYLGVNMFLDGLHSYGTL